MCLPSMIASSEAVQGSGAESEVFKGCSSGLPEEKENNLEL